MRQSITQAAMAKQIKPIINATFPIHQGAIALSHLLPLRLRYNKNAYFLLNWLGNEIKSVRWVKAAEVAWRFADWEV